MPLTSAGCDRCPTVAAAYAHVSIRVRAADLSASDRFQATMLRTLGIASTAPRERDRLIACDDAIQSLP